MLNSTRLYWHQGGIEFSWNRRGNHLCISVYLPCMIHFGQNSDQILSFLVFSDQDIFSQVSLIFLMTQCNRVCTPISVQLPVAWGECRAAGPGSQTRGSGEEAAAPSSGHWQGLCCCAIIDLYNKVKMWSSALQGRGITVFTDVDVSFGPVELWEWAWTKEETF